MPALFMGVRTALYWQVMIRINSEQAMREFGERIGRSVRGGEVIELIGDVGAGKTTFVRGLATGMGVTETVQSPSFTISRVYDTDDGRRLVHYDFYRLSDAGIMADELSEAMHDDKAVIVIEWADAVANVLPEERVTLTIRANADDTRMVEASVKGEVNRELEEQLQ